MSEASVTDWIQVGVSAAGFILSAVGLLYIVINLREQTKVNQGQFELLALERKRHIRESKPVIVVTFDKRLSNRNIPRFETFLYKISCTNSSALAVCFEFTLIPAQANYSMNMAPLGTAPYGIQRDTDLSFCIQFLMPGAISATEIRIHYKDADGEEHYDDVRVLAEDVHAGFIGKKTKHPGGTICNLQFERFYEEYNMYPEGSIYNSGTLHGITFVGNAHPWPLRKSVEQ